MMPVKTMAKRMLRAALLGGLLALTPAVLVGVFFFGMFALGSAPLGGEGFRDVPPPSPLTPRDYLLLGIPLFLVLGGAMVFSLAAGMEAFIRHTLARQATANGRGRRTDGGPR